jgi:PAS domain-containing protein
MTVPSDVSQTVISIIAAIGTAGVGTFVLNWLRERREARSQSKKEDRESETARDTRRREDERGAIEHLNRIIEMKDREYEQQRKEHDEDKELWYKERAGLLRERDRISAAYQNLAVQATMMQDRLAVLQGIGPEGAERMDPILVLDDDAVIRWANDPAGTFLGWPTLVLIGQPVTKIIAPERHEFFAREFRQIVDRLMSLPDGYPLLHRYVGRAQRSDGSVIKVCVIMNGFRLYKTVKWRTPDGRDVEQEVVLPVYRVHLRQRWETSDVAARLVPIPSNSSDSSDPEVSPVTVEPGADDRDEVVVAGPAP